MNNCDYFVPVFIYCIQIDSYRPNTNTGFRIRQINVNILHHVTLEFKTYAYLFTYLRTYLLTYLLTYLFTPLCRVLLEKLTGLQPVKKFPAFHGKRRFITALTSVRHLSLSWGSPIQSI